MSALLGDRFSPGGIWVWRAVAQGQLQMQIDSRSIWSQAAPRFLCSGGSRRGPLRLGIWAEVVVLPVLSGVSALLEDQLSPRGIWVWKAVAQGQLQVQMETRSSILFLTYNKYIQFLNNFLQYTSALTFFLLSWNLENNFNELIKNGRPRGFI